MKKQTAVEWLEWKLGIKDIVGPEHSGLIRIFAEAKQMEREQFEKLEEFEYWKEWKNK